MAQVSPIAKIVYVQDVEEYFNYHNVEDVLAEIGATLAGITGLVNWSEASSTSGANVTVGATSFSALSSLANADACIVPKGNGAVLASIPDATAAQGNKRGLNSVDLQMARSAANQVATNQWSGIVAGRNNRAAGNSSFIGGGNGNITLDTDTAVVGGRNGSVTGQCAFMGGGGDGAGNTINGTGAATVGGNALSVTGSYGFAAAGQGSTVSGVGAVALGGSGVTVGGANSVGMGANALDNSVIGTVVHGIAQFAASAPCQNRRMLLKANTTDATATRMTSNGAAAGTTNQFILFNNSSALVIAKGTVRQNTTGDHYEFTAEISIRRGANAASTVVESAVVTDVFKSAGAAAWTVAFAADTTNGGIACTFTGEAAKTLRAGVHLDGVEVVG